MTPAAKFSTTMSLAAQSRRRHLDGLGALQVERDALLPLVVLVEVAAAVRPRLELGERGQQARDAEAGRALDADHLGAQVRELERAERAGPHPGEVGDAEARERRAACHLRDPLADQRRGVEAHLGRAPRPCAARGTGPGVRSCHGVALNRYGAPGMVTGPATGWSRVTKKPRALRCGEARRSPMVETGANGHAPSLRGLVELLHGLLAAPLLEERSGARRSSRRARGGSRRARAPPIPGSP